MDEKTEKIQIYSYAKVWNLEHSIYSIGNVNLPVPIHPNNALYFIGSFLFIIILGKIFPLINLFPVIVRCLIIPYAITYVLRKKKLDGKSPIKYFIGLLIYELFIDGRYFERFKGYSERPQIEKMNWICSVRYHKH